VFTLLAIYTPKFIRKHNVWIYIVATILAILTFVTRYKIPITEPFTQGYLGLSLLYIVMVTGALNNKSKLYKKYMGVRREYSIVGFILITPHALKYVLEFLQHKINFQWLGVIPFLIMIPLFITSFVVIRKRIKPATWRKIQSFAYIAYIFIFVHLIVVADRLPTIIYSVLFIPYIVMKIIKEVKKANKASIAETN
jgi:DMSO/TMAO reductase YedYZ heme-binding membrane subunit